MQIKFDLGPKYSVEIEPSNLEAGTSPAVLPLKFETEELQNEGRPPMHRLKITNKHGHLLLLLDIVELQAPLWIVNPDKKSDEPDLFTTAFIGAEQENMEDITVTPDKINGKVAAIVTGKARVGKQLYPTIKAIWGPTVKVVGLIHDEVIIVSSFFSFMTTARFLETLTFEVK